MALSASLLMRVTPYMHKHVHKWYKYTSAYLCVPTHFKPILLQQKQWSYQLLFSSVAFFFFFDNVMTLDERKEKRERKLQQMSGFELEMLWFLSGISVPGYCMTEFSGVLKHLIVFNCFISPLLIYKCWNTIIKNIIFKIAFTYILFYSTLTLK